MNPGQLTDIMPRMELNFTKLNGLGNDFIFADNRDGQIDLSPEQVTFLCDRHFGVGADGIMLIGHPYREGSDYSWHFSNADGSVAEMCGNGIRCAVSFLDYLGVISPEKDRVTIDTLAGPISVTPNRSAEGALLSTTVDMGIAVTDPHRIPTTAPATVTLDHEDGSSEGAVVDGVLAIAHENQRTVFEVTCVSMGNPHVVVWASNIGTTVDHVRLSEFGPAVQALDEFPASANVEVIEVLGRDAIKMRVWERGVGETLACGTGACAVAYAALLKGEVDPRVTVQLPGGSLAIDIDPVSRRILMTGPATVVFDGRVEL